MKRTVKNLFDHGIESMPVCMILIAGTLTKVGYPDWGLAWIAGLCAPLILADLSNFRGRGAGASVTSRNPLADRP